MTLEILTSDALAPIRHGFFTRRGGASSGVFAGLNCGHGSSDLAEIVAINRNRVAEAMQTTSAELQGLHQVHSARAVVADPTRDTPEQADGIVTDQPGMVLAVLTADCQPVLFADAEAGVIGAAHAGWRGALDGVLEATIEAMETLGAARDRITAVIGPSISQAAYEVGPEFLDDFLAEDQANTRFFANGHGDRMLFDLPAYGLYRLRRAGVGQAEWTRHCTYSDPDRFYSYRRTTHLGEADYGRLISTIRL
ncbi:peptidoglycan editing factor PgeF [Pseudooceanicola sp.]|uniref:peptidoglycan editing factor PgeF n=1 Tax=Pseudooceanicola sp. TaxID=1914328 RepID=UPI0026358BE4|nr:peptidoglycan editing factor PgeF [Pseudooceanicola sp.]MDF1854433.1 peptidoglycan editing factor PgeF [Pseudooceanicola sp.]